MQEPERAAGQDNKLTKMVYAVTTYVIYTGISNPLCVYYLHMME